MMSPVHHRHHHHQHHCFMSTYHASPDMTDMGFHTSVDGTFCQHFIHLNQNWSTGQSVILSSCIIAFSLVVESKFLHQMYFLSLSDLCSPCRAREIHGTRWAHCKARHHWDKFYETIIRTNFFCIMNHFFNAIYHPSSYAQYLS